VGRLFAPVFFFHGGKRNFGGIEAGNLKINATIGTYDDFANDHIGEGDFGITFRAVSSGHGFLLD
jgi:hypothetical protein